MKLRQALANDRKWIRDQPVFGVEEKKNWTLRAQL